MNSLAEIRCIWTAETLRAFRSGRIVVLLLLFLAFVALSLLAVGFFHRQINAQLMQQISDAKIDSSAVTEQMTLAKKQFVATFFSDDAAMIDSLANLPVILLIVFKLAVRFIPLFVALMGYDQLAGEVAPKSIRYLLVRARRSSIVLGKFLAQATVVAVLISVSTLLMVLGTEIVDTSLSPGDLALWTVRLTGASFSLAIAYLALTTLCSTVVQLPSVALIVNLIALFATWLVAFVGEMFVAPGQVAAVAESIIPKTQSYAAYLQYASIWHYANDLLHPQFTRLLTAYAALAGFTLFFIGLSNLVLRPKDL